MSFQRTRLSADRTLMSIIRTSLSLIGFGFTIHKFFEHLEEQGVLRPAKDSRAFGATLVWLGIGMITLGILFHGVFMLGLRHERNAMERDGLIHAESKFPPSYTLAIAILLLLVGVGAIASMVFHRGPFR